MAILLAVGGASAHHSTAMYDMANPVTVKGTVKRFEWTNPHAFIFIDVKDEKGNVVEWEIELMSLNHLRSYGWMRDTVKSGDEISCTGGRAKSGAPSMISADDQAARRQGDQVMSAAPSAVLLAMLVIGSTMARRSGAAARASSTAGRDPRRASRRIALRRRLPVRIRASLLNRRRFNRDRRSPLAGRSKIPRRRTSIRSGGSRQAAAGRCRRR